MQQESNQKLLDLIPKLQNLNPGSIKAMIGFDGFVDEIVHVVDKRIDADNFVRINSMAEYGERIRKSAGLSTNIEMVTVRQKLGGNGTILANALIEYGLDLTYIGALGLPAIHPVFQEMARRCKAIPLSEPALTDAIEFFDGKIISSKLESLKKISWASILEHVGEDRFARILDDCDLVGFGNWTMILNMSDIWKHILSDILPKLTRRDRQPVLFIDLADPEKRSPSDIAEALRLIDQFAGTFNVIFGLNKKEACEIASILGMPLQPGDFDTQDLQLLAEYIFEKMKVAAVVIHPVKEACVVNKDGFVRVTGPYCQKPRLTTGAGDNFNAGFIFGVTMGLGMEDSLILGTATSGYYVRQAHSPDLSGIRQFLKDWAIGCLD